MANDDIISQADEMVQQAYLLQYDKVDDVSDKPDAEALQEKLLAEALEMHKEALAIYLANGEQEKAAQQYDNLNFVLFPATTDEREQNYLNALSIYDQLNAHKESAETWERIAVLYQFADAQKSADAYGEAVKRYEAAGLTSEALEAMQNIGDALQDAKREKEAIAQFEKTKAAAEAASDFSRAGTQLLKIADLHSSNEEYSKALDYFKQALSVFQNANDKDNEFRAVDNLFSLSVLLEKKDDAKKYQAQLLALEPQVDPELVKESRFWREVSDFIENEL